MTPDGTDLTTPAKTILTKPTFLPANVGEAAGLGLAEKSAASGLWSRVGLLPAAGAATLAFGAGAAIGTEICNVVGIDGCWHIWGDEADPPHGLPPGTHGWTMRTIPEYGVPAYTFWFDWSQSTGVAFEHNIAGLGNPNCKTVALPGGTSYTQVTQHIPHLCTFEGKPQSTDWRAALRHGMANRNITYNPTDNPSVPNVKHTAPLDWSKKLANAFENPAGTGLGVDPVERVAQDIASQIEGSKVKSPYPQDVEVPSCSGMKRAECLVELEELELVPEVKELEWDEAVIEELEELEPEKTREKEAERVITILPPPGTTVKTGTETEVITNPDEESMPKWVPAPDPGETAKEYKERKVALPPWLPEEHELDPNLIDPSKGPDEVVRTWPQAGTRVNPEASTEVEVYYNPPSAPPAAGAWSPPPISGIDLGPLAGVAIGCNDFPFGVFCWLGEGLTNWDGPSGVCPAVGVPLGSSVKTESELPFDFCQFEPAMEIVRPVIVLVAAFCLAYFFAAAAMGLGGGSNED